jgi:hypothetical protein
MIYRNLGHTCLRNLTLSPIKPIPGGVKTLFSGKGQNLPQIQSYYSIPGTPENSRLTGWLSNVVKACTLHLEDRLTTKNTLDLSFNPQTKFQKQKSTNKTLRPTRNAPGHDQCSLFAKPFSISLPPKLTIQSLYSAPELPFHPKRPSRASL